MTMWFKRADKGDVEEVFSISCDREHDFHRVEEQEIRGFAGKILLIVGEANR